MIFSLSSPPTRASFSSELYFVERGTGPGREKKDRAGGSKEEGESGGTSSPCRGHSFFKGGRGGSNNTFPIGKKKGIGWRPQKNTGALSSQLGSSFSFERRLKNGGESLFSAGGEGFASTDALFGSFFQCHFLSVRRRKTVATKTPPRHVGGSSVCKFHKKDGR
jgi:hypothetical protein